MSDTLYDALELMKLLCDGARSQDGSGYNKIDADLVPYLENRLPKTAHALWRIIGKYKKQLLKNGINYDNIAEPKRYVPPPTKTVQKIIAVSGENFVITFPYDKDLVLDVHKIGGEKFNKNTKEWTVPVSNVDSVFKFTEEHRDFQLTENAAATISSIEEEKTQAFIDSSALSSDYVVEGLGGELRPFQKAAVKYAVEKKRVILGDQPGLGKTIEALATIHAAQAYPALIICPACVKLNWQREIGIWLPNVTSMVIDSKTEYADKKITIINYDILNKHIDWLTVRNFRTVVADECHAIKEKTSKRSIATVKLMSTAEYRLLLSGTPILSRPVELVNQINALGRIKEFGSEWLFKKTYCDAKYNGFGWDFSGASNTNELNIKMRRGFYIRREKKDVLTELPPKQRTIIPIDIDNEKEYYDTKNGLLDQINANSKNDRAFYAKQSKYDEEEQKKNLIQHHKDNFGERGKQLALIGKLRQAAARGKLAAIKEWIEDFLTSENKLVVFAHHIEIQDRLMDFFPDAVHIRGDDTLEERQIAQEKFQNDKDCKLIICSLLAAGQGINLFAASTVIFVEQGWTPGAHDQAESRCHRLGQLGSVNAYYFLGRDTIDEDIYYLIKKKREIVYDVTVGKEENQQLSIQNDLINKFKEYAKKREKKDE